MPYQPPGQPSVPAGAGPRATVAPRRRYPSLRDDPLADSCTHTCIAVMPSLGASSGGGGGAGMPGAATWSAGPPSTSGPADVSWWHAAQTSPTKRTPCK